MEPQRPQDARSNNTDQEKESPEAEPYLPDRPQRGDEDDEDHELDDERLDIERPEPAERAFGRTPAATEEQQRRSPCRRPGREKQRAEPRAVRPDRPVRDRQQHARVPRHEESEEAAETRDQLRQQSGRALPTLLPPGEGGARAEQQDRPRAERNRRPALEHQAREVLRLEQHVPEAERPPEVERQQRS